MKRHSLSNSILREAGDSFEAVGPWFLTVFCLVVMGLTVYSVTGKAPVIFYLLMTYATAFSLILSSPLHTMYNRHLADVIFLGRFHAIVNGLIALSTLVILVTSTFSSLVIFSLSAIPINLKIGFVGLTTFLSLLWCISSVLCALQKEKLVFFLFLSGIAASLILFLLLKTTDTQTLVLIFCMGMAFPVAGGYSYVIKLYLRTGISMDWDFLKRHESMKLGLSHFTFSLGFWIDKFIFWFSPKTGEAIDPLFHYYGEYDFPFFVAITIMMIGSLLVYRGIKKRVNEPYRAFIFKLSNNFPFSELALEKFKLVQGIGQASSSIFLFYGGISVVVLFFVYMRAVFLPWRNPFVFHYLILGTIFFSLYFLYFLLLQYLDEYGPLLKLNILFLAVNIAGTLFSIRAGWPYYGTGFMAASIISSAVGFIMVNSRVGGLEYEVFRRALHEQKRDRDRGKESGS